MVNLLHSIFGVDHVNILIGPSNGLELLNFFQEALEIEDIFGNPEIPLSWIIVVSITDDTLNQFLKICLKKLVVIWFSNCRTILCIILANVVLEYLRAT